MAGRYQGTEEEVRALDAFVKLMRSVNSLRSRLAEALAGAGLTESQLGVLEALLHLGPMCQKEIGEKLLLSGGNITMVVDNLARRGLVERRRDERDRRYVNVHLTDEGLELIRGYFPRHAAAIARGMGALTPEEQAELGRLCRILGTGRRE